MNLGYLLRMLFIREVARLGRLPFELTEEDWDIVKKLEMSEVEAECTDARYSSKDVLEAMKAEIKNWQRRVYEYV